MPSKTILVQLAERDTTVEALRLACSLARREPTGAAITLLHMSRVPHLSWLGSTDAVDLPGGASKETAIECASIAEESGVPIRLLPFQYHSLIEAIADAADFADAAVVFASLPHARLPWLARFQAGLLRKRLAEHGRELVLLNGNAQPAHARQGLPLPARTRFSA